MSVLTLVFTGLATFVQWTGRTYPGYGRWLWAGPLTVFSLVLLNLRPKAPGWVSIVAANAVLVLASIVHFEGAREFRGLPPRRWLVYIGGFATIGAVSFFLYIVPNLNARAAVVSAFLGVVFLLGCVTLLSGVPPTHRLGLRLTGTLFGLSAATLIVRAFYCAFGPPLGDLFALSGVDGAIFLILSVEIGVLPIGYILLADERVISDLKDAKESAWNSQVSLRESEERLRLAMSSGTIGVWDWDVSNARLTVSPELGRIYGVDVTKLRSYEDFVASVHPDDIAAVESERDTSIDNHQPFDTEFRIVLPSGAIRWIAARGQAYYNENGRVVRVLGNNIDITERKSAEEALREREERLRIALDASGGGSWTWDARTNYLDWDDRFRVQFGFTPVEPPTFDAWLTRVHQNDRPQVLGLLDEILHATTKDEWNNTYRIVRQGTIVWMQSLGRAYRDAKGQVTRLTGLELDITDRKRMEEERAAEGQRKDEFLSMLGHELRNPLATISTAVQLLSGGLTDEERVSLNGMMGRQVKLMGRLLDDLLDLGRMTHGYIQLRKERIHLAKFLQHVSEATQSIAAERGQELTLRLPSEIVTFKADEVRLEQIAINLLSNASKYTPQGGRIEFSGIREGSEVVIRCKDNGRGIPPEMQEKIFEPFTRLEPFSDSRGEASLGIGLALVKRMVELHGGTISVESDGPGMGSEFVVRFPLESALSDQPVAPEAKAASTSGLSRSIILVEDNSDLAGTMVIALEKAGYRVTVFSDALSALAGLSDLKPHAIVLDIGLPGMDGYKLATELKEKPHLQHTLFIGLSGFKRREATKSRDDFDHYFNKPVDLPALLSFLDTHTGATEAATAHQILEKGSSS